MMLKSLLKNTLFLLVCVAIAVMAWGMFQIFGEYTFLIMLVIGIANLLYHAKPKFGKKK